MAGESARDVARRKRERAEALQRSAAAYERGAEGEEWTATALSVLPPEWVVLHDLRWPGRARANLDHVAVGPGGVYVIDSKYWSGTLSTRGGVLRQNGRSRASTVASCAAAGRAVAEVLPGLRVQPVLCFTTAEGLDARVDDVLVCTTWSVAQLLRSRPTVLGPEQVREVAATLSHLAPARVPAARVGTPYPQRRAAAARPAASAPARRRKRGPGLGRTAMTVLAGAAMVVVLRSQPELLTAGVDWFAGWWAGLATA
ncbi:nuclease-related domain-containing protein [Nocardioides sp. SYSU D00038]|uniref:nuclease-related domain-containing protein n=1 Tax=Nocardioides sp. SYSU D00038 TaxID=2812554 RepID=UPI0019678E76|nr:nuclease-related domain-containing protein [Nocardioides sp. SYSU D00038]